MEKIQPDLDVYLPDDDDEYDDNDDGLPGKWISFKQRRLRRTAELNQKT